MSLKTYLAEQRRLFHALPDEWQERFIQEEWQMAKWVWMTTAIPLLAMSISFALLVGGLGGGFLSGFMAADQASRDAFTHNMANATLTDSAIVPVMTTGVHLILYGPIMAMLMAPVDGFLAMYIRFGMVRKWHKRRGILAVPVA